MKKVLSLICVLCLFISIFQVNSFAAGIVDPENPLFSLEISEYYHQVGSDFYSHAVFGDSVHDGETVTYSTSQVHRPYYGKTWNNVPYADFGRLNDSNAPDSMYSHATVSIEGIDNPETPEHETIADKNIMMEMWIRPFGNRATNSGTTRGRIVTLTDSVGGYKAFDVGLYGEDVKQPWYFWIGPRLVLPTSASDTTVKYSAAATDYWTAPNWNGTSGSNVAGVAQSAIDSLKLNDGQWNHVVVARYYNANGGWGCWTTRLYVNGKFITEKYAGGGRTSHKSLTRNVTNAEGETVKENLNFNQICLGSSNPARSGEPYSFRGHIAALNIYEIPQEVTIANPTYLADEAKALYEASELKEKLHVMNGGSKLEAKAGEEELSKATIADLNPKTIDIKATIVDYVEAKREATKLTSTVSMQTYVNNAIAVGYDKDGKVICSADLTTAIKNSEKSTISTGTLVVPEDKTINDIKVFFWDEELRPYAAVACLQ